MTKPIRWKAKVFFAWYDLWVGAFWDRKKRALYICPLPCVVLMLQFSGSKICEYCGCRPAINEPDARWGRLRFVLYMPGVPTVGVFCSQCGKADSDAGK
jgi:hypothetical protein